MSNNFIMNEYNSKLKDINDIVANKCGINLVIFKREIADDVMNNLNLDVFEFERRYNYIRELSMDDMKEIEDDFKSVNLIIERLTTMSNIYIYKISYNVPKAVSEISLHNPIRF